MRRYTDEYIEHLLSKFMDGTSTLDEESILGEYFRTQGGRPEWAEYRRMFAYFDSGMKGSLPTAESIHADSRRHKHMKILLAAAASVAVLCIMLFALTPSDNVRQQTAKVESPQKSNAIKQTAQVESQKESDTAKPAKQPDTPQEEAPTARENSPEKTATSSLGQQSTPQPMPARYTATNTRRHPTASRDTQTETAESTANRAELMDGTSEEAQKILLQARMEIERAQNKIAKYNSEKVLAQIERNHIADEITDESHGTGDAYDSPSPIKRYLRAVTMQ